MAGYNLRNLIFAICIFEILWYIYSIGICWYGIGQAYYNYVMRLTKILDSNDMIYFSLGILICVPSSWCTMALFYVAYSKGENPKLIYLYCIKNLITISLGFLLFGQQYLNYRSEKLPLPIFLYNTALFLGFGLILPLINILVTLDYYKWIMKRNFLAANMLNSYEKIMKVKRAKAEKRKFEKKKHDLEKRKMDLMRNMMPIMLNDKKTV